MVDWTDKYFVQRLLTIKPYDDRERIFLLIETMMGFDWLHEVPNGMEDASAFARTVGFKKHLIRAERIYTGNSGFEHAMCVGVVHTHPRRGEIEPSDQDIATAARNKQYGFWIYEPYTRTVVKYDVTGIVHKVKLHEPLARRMRKVRSK